MTFSLPFGPYFVQDVSVFTSHLQLFSTACSSNITNMADLSPTSDQRQLSEAGAEFSRHFLAACTNLSRHCGPFVLIRNRLFF